MNMHTRLKSSAHPHPVTTLYRRHVSAGPRFVRAGQRIDQHAGAAQDVYIVEQGQIVVTRDWQPIDLIEAGEPLITQLYPDADFIARTGCILSPCIAPATHEG